MSLKKNRLLLADLSSKKSESKVLSADLSLIFFAQNRVFFSSNRKVHDSRIGNYPYIAYSKYGVKSPLFVPFHGLITFCFYITNP